MTRKAVRPAAPEDESTPTHRYIAPSVIAGALLLGLFFVFVSIHMVTLADKTQVFLQLTTWTHALVAIYLLVMRTLDEQTAAIVGIAVLGISLAVMMGRFASIHVRAKNSGEVIQDMVTHTIVPATMLFFVLAGHVPRVDRANKSANLRKACGYALFFLLTWLLTNVAAQYSRNGRWVYRTAMNPKSEQGRKELATTAIVAVACVIVAAGIEYIRPQRAFEVAPKWPLKVISPPAQVGPQPREAGLGPASDSSTGSEPSSGTKSRPTFASS